MQVYAYTDEVIDRLNAYALSIPPSPTPSYHLLHPEVHVPPGCLPIKTIQFFRCDPLARHPKGYHWAIFVPTSPISGIGHYYEVSGGSPLYRVRSIINDYSAWRGLERGSHTVGYVLPTMMPNLEAHFALVPVEILKRSWNSQSWVCNALQGLNHPHMFAIGMTLEDLVTQMAIVSAAWEAGNAK
ncbi:hypothetical protein EV363DRAFT_1374443 [Boletus edulis]|nr:hypothetical protein EV363DRAFT_1374443 [Boletus edulis]